MIVVTSRKRAGSRGHAARRSAGMSVLLAAALLAATIPSGAADRVLERVSVRPDGGGSAGGGRYLPALSADGRVVAFSSAAEDLVEGDTNGVEDVFVRDLEAGATTRVSLTTDGGQGDDASSGPTLSADGRYVAFESAAGNLVEGDDNRSRDVFVHDRETGETTRVSLATDGGQGDGASWGPSISADGRAVAFASAASQLVEGDTNEVDDVFLRDLETGRTTRVSVAPDGSEGDDVSAGPSISGDGRLVVFESFASNLTADSPQGFWGIYLHDLETGQTSLLSVNEQGSAANEDNVSPVISSDGRSVAYTSLARDLTADSPQGFWGIYLHDLESGQTSLLTSSSDGSEQDGDAFAPAISSDGRSVAFHASATNLVVGDTNGVNDVFVHDRVTGMTLRISAPPEGGEADDHSEWPAISGDGSVIAFQSWATNLVADDADREADIFVSIIP